MTNWYTDIENDIDKVEKSQAICEAVFNLLSTNEISLVLVLYECDDIETILERLRIDESTYYRTLERIKRKLSPYFTDMGFLNPSDGERKIGASGKEKAGQIGGDNP